MAELDKKMRHFGRTLPLASNAENIETEPQDVVPVNEDEDPLTADILAEEQRLEEASLEKQEAARERKKAEFAAQRHSDNEKMEQELQAYRIKRLQSVLKKSEFFSAFIQKKFSEQAAQKKLERERASAKKVKSESKRPSKPGKHSDKYDMAKIIETLNMDAASDQSDFGSDVFEEENTDYDDTYVNTMGNTVSKRQPRLFEGGAMRDYQLDGLQWLEMMDGNSVNGILGDEMGLGKTIQVIALLCQLIGMGLPGPYIIVGPLSTLPNWLSEFERFAPKLPVLLFHGNETQRKALLKDFRKRHEVGSVLMPPIILTSFQVPLVEPGFFRSVMWRYLIVDEGHRLKNHRTRLAIELQNYNSSNRLILTGTPLQNNLMELWALLHFLLPDIFAGLDEFASWFETINVKKNLILLEQEKENKVVSTLQKVLSPFLLRRTKADVNLCLPPKKEVLVECPMSPLQIQLYQATLDRKLHLLQRKESEKIPDLDGPRPKRRCVVRRQSANKTYAEPEDQDEFKEEENNDVLEVDSPGDTGYKFQIKMQAPHMVLRHIANHPYLIQTPVHPGTRDIRVDEDLIKHSGKMLVMDAMLHKLKQRGHKVLVFSEFTMVLDLLEDMMGLRNYRYCRLDGRVKIDDRQHQIFEFNTDPEVLVFLISTRAGGLGINLVAADTVILYDSSYNPQVDLQAQDRCHRIGQTRPVVVYRFYTKGTVDKEIMDWAQDKRRLEKVVIRKGAFQFENKMRDMEIVNLKELEKVLTDTDHEAVFHSNGYVFSDAELNILLDRSALMDWKNKPSTSALEKTEVNHG